MNSLQIEFENCKFIIIDEISMVGCAMLKKIDLRLRSIKPESSHIEFGGIFLYLFGDINQLPPVNDGPFYTSKFGKHIQIYNQGQLLFQNITHFEFLSSSFRQIGPDQMHFRDLLDRLGNGQVTENDWKLLQERSIQRLNHTEIFNFKNAIRLFSTNQEVKSFNIETLRNLKTPVANIPAVHNCTTAASSDEKLANGLLSNLCLAINCRIMLRCNLWIQAGLVNGALGFVRDIIYSPENQPPMHPPIIILVEFDNYKGPTLENSKLVPIVPIKKEWKDNNILCTRLQFPLNLAYAITIHKSQGLTLEKAIINIGKREIALGLSYVAFSRVKTFEGIALDQTFSFDRITSKLRKGCFEDRKKELQRMKNYNIKNY